MSPHASSWMVDGDCAPSYLEVWLDPLGAYRLLGLPVNELSGQLIDLADVLGGAARRLAEQLRETPSWRQRFALMDQFLLRRMAGWPRTSPQVGWAWQRLVTTGGTVPIGQIADEVGWSHKHLIVQFRRQAGLRPKTAARLVRFDRVWRHVDQRRPLDWGQVAADTGYADQAHLIRDFRQFTGITPTGYQAVMAAVAEDRDLASEPRLIRCFCARDESARNAGGTPGCGTADGAARRTPGSQTGSPPVPAWPLCQHRACGAPAQREASAALAMPVRTRTAGTRVRTVRTGSLAPRPALCHAAAVRAAGCPMRSLGHHPYQGYRYGAPCRDPAEAGVTAWCGRP